MRKSIRAAIVVAVSVVALTASSAFAQTGPSEIEQLKQDLRRIGPVCARFLPEDCLSVF